MAFKSLPSLKSAGIKPSPWIYIVHILIIKPHTCTQVQTFISSTFCVWLSGLWGYQAIRFERFVITLGVLRHSFYTRRNFRLQVKESDLHYRFRKPLYDHYSNLNYSFIIPLKGISNLITDSARLGHWEV
jgi:hypothetical protein